MAHIAHALPAEPHAIVVWFTTGTHSVWRQQPSGQEDGVHSQVPEPLQACPAAQATQRAPPLPQAPTVGAVTH
jgi:hypothetical protein